MKEKLEQAAKKLAENAEKADKGIEAQQFSQAALNVVNALATLYNMK